MNNKGARLMHLAMLVFYGVFILLESPSKYEMLTLYFLIGINYSIISLLNPKKEGD